MQFQALLAHSLLLSLKMNVLPCCHGPQIIYPKAGISCHIFDRDHGRRDGYFKQFDRSVPETIKYDKFIII